MTKKLHGKITLGKAYFTNEFCNSELIIKMHVPITMDLKFYEST